MYSDRLPLATESAFNLSHLLEELLEKSQSLLHENQLIAQIVIDPKLPSQLFGHTDLLLPLLIDLMAYACQSIHGDSLTLKIDCLNASSNQAWVLFSLISSHHKSTESFFETAPLQQQVEAIAGTFNISSGPTRGICLSVTLTLGIDTESLLTFDGHGFPNLSCVDRAAIKKKLGNNSAAFLKMLGLFPRNHGQDPRLIRTDYLAGDFSEAAHRAHKLKGSASFLGLTRIYALSIDLEDAIEQCDQAAFESLVEKLDLQIQQLLFEIEKLGLNSQ